MVDTNKLSGSDRDRPWDFDSLFTLTYLLFPNFTQNNKMTLKFLVPLDRQVGQRAQG